MKLLKRLLGHPSRGPAPALLSRLAPARPFFAIGDLHGSPHLLLTLLEQLDRHDPSCPVVFVGDYVDRGERSAETLFGLMELEKKSDREIICLRGNHDQMVLDFLSDPERHGPAWLANGGLTTLWSFGLGAGSPIRTAGQHTDLRDTLRREMGAATEAWLQARPLSWMTGNVFVSHAGPDPALALEDQTEAELLWGNRSAYQQPALQDLWSVQGHVIVEDAHVQGQQIMIDTGAYATSRLSAVHVAPGALTFLQTGC